MTATGQAMGRHVSTESPYEMSSAVSEMMCKARAPGLSLVVVNHESVILSASYGLADIERSRPVVASTSFLWFSMSKLVDRDGGDAPRGRGCARPRRADR